MAVAEWTGALVDWSAELEGMKARIAPAFGRAETRASAGAFIDGLLGPAERKTGWMLAEQAGLKRPHRIQSLLGRGRWSADTARATGCATTWRRRWATRVVCSSSTRRGS
jgi:SRSO17 transposase